MNTIYFSARRGYLGPAATLPEFHGKGLDYASLEVFGEVFKVSWRLLNYVSRPLVHLKLDLSLLLRLSPLILE